MGCILDLVRRTSTTGIASDGPRGALLHFAATRLSSPRRAPNSGHAHWNNPRVGLANATARSARGSEAARRPEATISSVAHKCSSRTLKTLGSAPARLWLMPEDSNALAPQVAQKERTLHHSRNMVTSRFRDIDFQHGLDAALAACSQEMADEAEVIATAARIIDGDPDSWIDEWMGTAGAVWADAADAEQDGRLSEGCTAYRHACTYYAAALNRVFHCNEPERQPAIWRRQRDCWERALALEPTPVEHLRIPFGTEYPAGLLLLCAGHRQWRSAAAPDRQQRPGPS